MTLIHGRRDEGRRQHPDDAEDSGDSLPLDEVVRAPGNVEPGDPTDRPEAVPDQGRDGQKEHPVEPPQDGTEVEDAESRRPERRGPVSSVGDQSTFTRAWATSLPVEVLLEDAERSRRRGRRAVAAVLDHRADDELGVVGGAVAAPPRLILEVPDRIAREIDDLLGGARLARDRDRDTIPKTPDDVPLVEWVAVHSPHAPPAGCRVDTGIARRVGRELLQGDGLLAVRARLLDTRDDVRGHELASVRDHRVEARHLQRRHSDVFLADRELNRVARVPRLVPVALERLLPPGRRRHDGLPRRGFVADIEPGGCPEAELPGPLLQPAPLCRAAFVEAVPDVVEVRVARCREGFRQVHRPVHVGIPVLEDLLVTAVRRRRGALDRRVRREEMLLHRRERGDGLPRRAGRVRDLGDAVEPREVRLLGCRVVHERRELLRIDATDVDRGLVGRV